MKRKLLWIVLVITTFYTSSLMAIDFMGPPTTDLNEGQLAIGYTFHWSETDMFIYDVSGIANVKNVKVDDFEVRRNYITINYGLATNRWEAYTFLGFSNIKTYSVDDTVINFDGGDDFAIGAGTKVTTNINDGVDWGLLVQASWLHADDTVIGKVWDGEIDMVEIQGAAGPTIKLTKEWKVYGGVFGYWTLGDVDAKGSGPYTGYKISGDLDENSAVGGYIGTRIEIFNRLPVTAEYAISEDGYGFGMNACWKF